MRKAQRSDQNLVIDIISESFGENPSVLSVVKNDSRQKQRIKGLARYAFKTAIRRNGVYISSDNQGVAICYRQQEKKESLVDYWNQLLLVLQVIGFRRVPEVLRREAHIKRNKPKNEDYLYFWFFGVTLNGRGRHAAYELKDAIFEASKTSRLPIYLETSIEKNKNVYERFGFDIYHTWQQPNGTPLWFMKKNIP